jgi:hypothetical protein
MKFLLDPGTSPNRLWLNDWGTTTMGRTLDEIIKALPKSRRVRVVRRYRELQGDLKSIVSDPAVMGGEPVFAGTRIPLAHIAGIIRQGRSAP